MADYKRFISYIYRYEKGKKGANTGFSKIESKNGKMRISLNLRGVFLGENEHCKVYTLVRKNEKLIGILLGECRAENGLIDCRFETNSAGVGGTGYEFNQLCGVFIDTQRASTYAAGWDERPLILSRFTLEDELEVKAAGIDEKALNIQKSAEKAEELQNTQGSAEKEELENAQRPAVKAAEAGAEDISAQSEVIDQNQDTEKNNDQAESIVKESKIVSFEESINDLENKKNNAAVQNEKQDTYDNDIKAQSEGRNPIENENAGVENIEQNHPNIDIEPEVTSNSLQEEKSIIKNEALKAQIEKLKQDLKELTIGEEPILNEKPVEAEEYKERNWQAEKQPRPCCDADIEDVLRGKTEIEPERQPIPQLKPQPRPQTNPRPEVQPRPQTNPRPEIQPIPQTNSRPEPQPVPQTNSRPEPQPVPQTNSRPEPQPVPQTNSRPEPQSRPQTNTCPGSQPEPQTNSRPQPRPSVQEPQRTDECRYKEPVEKWENLKKTYKLIQPFQDTEIDECIQIEPKDLVHLQKEDWVLGNNSFLLHGYYNYRYLIMGRMLKNGRTVFILGVPGVFENQEKMMASMFGFPNFKPAKKVSAQNGEFGYWYRVVR